MDTGFLFWGDENVLKLIVAMVTQFHEYIKTIESYHILIKLLS